MSYQNTYSIEWPRNLLKNNTRVNKTLWRWNWWFKHIGIHHRYLLKANLLGTNIIIYRAIFPFKVRNPKKCLIQCLKISAWKYLVSIKTKITKIYVIYSLFTYIYSHCVSVYLSRTLIGKQDPSEIAHDFIWFILSVSSTVFLESS